ncbi:hypothetical protein [Microbispora sp. NBC_01389]|uniref:hypothetical protein n=1 Tax=Microbispora sp. NBC_01389 TaxID=2903584 RepID=UPI00324767C7
MARNPNRESGIGFYPPVAQPGARKLIFRDESGVQEALHHSDKCLATAVNVIGGGKGTLLALPAPSEQDKAAHRQHRTSCRRHCCILMAAFASVIPPAADRHRAAWLFSSRPFIWPVR